MQILAEYLEKIRNSRFYFLFLATLSGLLLALSWFPPFTPLIFLALAPLLWMEDHIEAGSYRRPGLLLWGNTFLAFVLWNVGVYWWLWNASGWMTLAAWLANAALQSLPIVFFGLIKRAGKNRFGYFALVVCWLGFEYLHLHWGFSWVWLNLGNVFGEVPEWVQWYEYTGAFGGTLWILLANILIFKILKKKSSLVPVGLLLFLPLAVSYGIYFTYEEQGPPTEIVVVQPNFDCYKEKFHYNSKTGERNQPTHVPYAQQVERMLNLSSQAITPQTRWLAWPETALHEAFNVETPFADPYVSQVFNWVKTLPQISLLTGADGYELYGQERKTGTARWNDNVGYYDVYNTSIFIGDTTTVPGFYHKSQLVIGAETVPFAPVLKPLILDFGGVSGGLGRQPEREVFFNQDGIAVAPVICYESVYGEFVTEFIQKGAHYILVITNDGWWGNTPGHRQHLAFSRLRAVENRRSVARSANTGISCFINQRGDIFGQLGYGETGAMAGTIQGNTQTTFYTRSGDYLGRLAAFLAPFMLLAALVKRRILPV